MMAQAPMIGGFFDFAGLCMVMVMPTAVVVDVSASHVRKEIGQSLCVLIVPLWVGTVARSLVGLSSGLSVGHSVGNCRRPSTRPLP